MKLQSRTNLNYILFSALIYLIVAGGFYVAVEYVIYEEVDRRLLVEKGDFEHFIEKHGYWETSCYFVEDKITVKSASVVLPVSFKDTLLLSRSNSEFIPFRQISFAKPLGKSFYRVSIRKSLIESNQLLKIITIVMLVVLSAGLSLLYLFQEKTARTLWSPFYQTLAKAKTFDVNKGEKLTLASQGVFEFNELNVSLNKMTDTVLKDYQSLREFTENASHEIQTPLALINSRVEGLIQDTNISDKHMAWIQDIHESTMRLSKLNQALLLLTKIENGQFNDTEFIDLTPILENNVAKMEEIFALKQIKVSVLSNEKFEIGIHPLLADVLVTNLLNNAVKHNISSGGVINISIASDRILISNTGAALTIEPQKLFERFQKQSKSATSLGLGLSIVKKICDISRLQLSYEYAKGYHTIGLAKV